MLVSEIQLFREAEPFYTHFTLIIWWGYILFLDGVIKKRRGVSFLADRPGFFAFLSVLSVFWWLVFEFYNCYLENWVYIGIPRSILHRYLCYILAYATITPAILTTFEAALTFWPPPPDFDATRHPRLRTLILWLLFGALGVGVPSLIPVREARHYLFGFVWVGFVFLIEPLAYWANSYSLLYLWAAGKRFLIWNVFGAGAFCGLLWEFWNYWAGAKWLYMVPILPRIRYFEMPILGFLGFLPFAWECMTLTVFTSLVVGRIRVSPHFPLPSRLHRTISRTVLAILLGIFLLAYGLQDRRYFPIADFRLSTSQAMGDPQSESAIALAATLEDIIFGNTEIAEGIQVLKNIVWTPETATRDNLVRLGRLQRHPDPNLRNQADTALREYAVAARFNWAAPAKAVHND